MGMKRKRNDLDDSPASSTSTTSSVRPSSPSPLPRYRQDDSMTDPRSMAPISSAWREATSMDPFYESSRPMLNSRTRKRWRDNRPDINTIHANTLEKLFNAQRHNPTAPPPEELAHPIPHAQSLQEQRQPQASLHAFWSLPVPRPFQDESLFNVPSERIPDPVTSSSDGVDRCEDCDAMVSSDDRMDWDGIGKDDSSHGGCLNCGKRLCDACAVAKNAWLCIQCA